MDVTDVARRRATLKIDKKKLKPYWDALQLLEDVHYAEVNKLEQEMQKELENKGLEFFIGIDGHYCGIGTYDRSMKLVQFDS